MNTCETVDTAEPLGNWRVNVYRTDPAQNRPFAALSSLALPAAATIALARDFVLQFYSANITHTRTEECDDGSTMLHFVDGCLAPIWAHIVPLGVSRTSALEDLGCHKHRWNFEIIVEGRRVANRQTAPMLLSDAIAKARACFLFAFIPPRPVFDSSSLPRVRFEADRVVVRVDNNLVVADNTPESVTLDLWIPLADYQKTETTRPAI